MKIFLETMFFLVLGCIALLMIFPEIWTWIFKILKWWGILWLFIKMGEWFPDKPGRDKM